MDDNTGDLILLRDILAREINTINNYQSLLEQASTPGVAEFIRHILEEEKEHVAEAIDLIKELDPNQANLLQKGGHWRSPDGKSTAAELSAPPIERRGESSARKWTVGSLRGEK